MRVETFDTPAAISLVVRIPAGEVEIEAVPAGETRVELEGLNDAGREAVESARVEGTRDRVEVGIEERRTFFLLARLPRLRARIRCPEGSQLRVDTVSADAAVRGRVGRAEVKSVSGDLSLDHVDGELELKTVSGDARVERVTGAARLNAVSGDLRVDEALASVTVRTVSGDQTLESVHEGEVEVQSVSGDVRIGIARGSRVFVDVRSLSGDTTSELALGSDPADGEGPLVVLRGKTVSGDVRIARAASPEPAGA